MFKTSLRVAAASPAKATLLGIVAACNTTETAYQPEGPPLRYQYSNTLKLGESVIIHGFRAQCGSLEAPSWEAAARSGALTPTSLGTYSDGGAGYRNSRRCGGPTPARGVLFTAIRVGSESFELFGDPMSITVTE